MKKGILLFTVFISFLTFSKVDALCYDKGLNDWAVNVKIKHTEIKHKNIFFTIHPIFLSLR